MQRMQRRRSTGGQRARIGRRTQMVAIGLGAMLAAGAAGCGGSGTAANGGARATSGTGSPHGVGLVRTAYATTVHAKTARIFFRETVQTSASGDSQSITGTGAADFVHRAFKLSINLPTGGSMTALGIGATEYIQIPPAARAEIPGHTPWVSIDLNKLSKAKLGGSLAQLTSGQDNDPSQMLAQLSAVSDRVTIAGRANVDGVPTTEYRAQIDLAKAAARARTKAGATAARQLALAMQKSLGTKTLPVKVWIGSDHLVRRFQEDIAAHAGGSGSVTATVMMDFYRYGAPVHLSAPPRGDVTDLTARVLHPPGVSSS